MGRMIRIAALAFSLALPTIAFPAVVAHASVVVFITSGTSYSVPWDWSSTNTIECVGAGGTGYSGAVYGGGGGAYAKISNLALAHGAAVSMAVAAGGSAGDTYFNGTSKANASLSCAAGASGTSSADGAGGTTANSVGTTKYAGGSGGSGAGGGAAGLHGAGNNGSSVTAGTGGSGDAGYGGAGGAVAPNNLSNGSPGGNGTEWSSSPAYGSGGGGGRGGLLNGNNGGDGGSYGGGGGAGTHCGNPEICGGDGIGGVGIAGLFVLTYTPVPTAQVLIYGGSVSIRGGSVVAK